MVALAAALFAGTGLSGLEPAPLALALGGLLFAALGARGVRRGRTPGGGPRWLRWMFLLALARGLAGAPPGREPEVPPADGLAVRAGPWRSTGSRADQGWLGRGARPARGATLFELRGAAPARGEEVALLATQAPVPWPRGPVPGPRASSGAFAGIATVLPDQLVRLRAPPAPLPLPPPAVRDGFARVRAALLGRADEVGPPRVAALVRALALGDRSALDGATADLFTRTGTRHLLAVSGLHVACMSALVLWPLGGLLARLVPASWTRARRGAPHLLRALLLAAYAPLAGGAPPVVRAALACALVALAPLVRGPAAHDEGSGAPAPERGPDPLSLWGLALALEALGSPGTLASPSVLLSYVATLGLIVGTVPLARAVARLLTRRAAALELAPAGALAAARRAARVALVRGVSVSLAASAAAMLATLPLVWTRFGELAPPGILLTPLSFPLVAWLVPACTLAVLCPALPSALVAVPAELWLRGLALADRAPFTPVPLPARPLPLLAAAVALAFAALAPRLGATLRARCRRGAALLGAAVLVPWSLAPRGLELHALDVGHGTAVVLRAPGEPCLIFDAGSRDRRSVSREALAPLLAAWEVDRPRVVLSHGDRDHLSSLRWLIERYPPRAWFGHLPPELAALLPADCERADLRHGRSALPRAAGSATAASAAPALELELLRGLARDDNEGSRSLAVRWRVPGEAEPRRTLLTGDAEGAGLAAELASGDLEGPLELLLLPHHGSRTELLGPLLEQARPARIWISSGDRPAVADELDARGARWAWTGRDGPLSRLPGPVRPGPSTGPGTELQPAPRGGLGQP